MRIGHGYDVHRLVDGNGIILGGVYLKCDKTLLAHSDGDVVLHALCDALLGASGLGDIGQHFPDTADENKNQDSRFFLKQVYSLVLEQGYKLANADITIIAQAPKMAPHIPAMIVNITQDLHELDHCAVVENINIKATTTEGLGYIGRGEGVAVHAVALLNESGRTNSSS